MILKYRIGTSALHTGYDDPALCQTKGEGYCVAYSGQHCIRACILLLNLIIYKIINKNKYL